jgi:hypothetical protein
MKLKANEQGTMNVLLVPVISLAVLFVAAGSFAVWAFMSRQDYKNNSDTKVVQAVAANTKTVQAEDTKQFAEAAKQPLKPYVGPDAFGSVKVMYPKTWSAYIDTTHYPLDAYFHTDYVPSGDTYNLRVRVANTAYDRDLASYKSRLTQGTITASPYSLAKLPKVIGTRLSGRIFSDDPNGYGDIILLPLRDKTLEIWTESPAYLADFNTYILPNVTFSP